MQSVPPWGADIYFLRHLCFEAVILGISLAFGPLFFLYFFPCKLGY